MIDGIAGLTDLGNELGAPVVSPSAPEAAWPIT